MPDLDCSSCGSMLLSSDSPLPPGIFLLCINCKRAYDNLNKRVAEDDEAAKKQSGVLGVDVPHLEEVVEWVCERKLPELVTPVYEASLSEADFHRKNQRCLIMSGLAESESDEDTLAFLNQTFLPALSVSSKFEVL